MRGMLLVGLVVALAGCGGKGSPSGPGGDPTLGEPVATLGAIAFWKEYDQNPLTADAKYKGKTVTLTGSGKVSQSADGRNYFGFAIISPAPMTNAQLARLSAQERKWFAEGAYPPNVVCYLSPAGEAKATELRPGSLVEITGVVVGRMPAEVWRGYVVELNQCLITK